MSNQIQAHSVFSSDQLFPVYQKYSNEHTPQKAFICLDIRTGAVDADYNATTGSTSFDVWNNLILHFSIPCELTTDEIEQLIANGVGSFQQILDCVSEEWNGNNYYAQISEQASELILELENELESVEASASVCTLAEFLQDEVFPAAGQSVSEFVEELAALNGENDCYYSTERQPSHEDVKDDLLALWAEYLYNGDDLPQAVAVALLEDGLCDDSAWLDELTELANQA